VFHCRLWGCAAPHQSLPWLRGWGCGPPSGSPTAVGLGMRPPIRPSHPTQAVEKGELGIGPQHGTPFFYTSVSAAWEYWCLPYAMEIARNAQCFASRPKGRTTSHSSEQTGHCIFSLFGAFQGYPGKAFFPAPQAGKTRIFFPA